MDHSSGMPVCGKLLLSLQLVNRKGGKYHRIKNKNEGIAETRSSKRTPD